MPQVICTLPNAADVISGYKFSKHAEGKISEDLPAEVANRLSLIAGYKLVDAKIVKKQPQSAQKPAVDDIIHADANEIPAAQPAKK